MTQIISKQKAEDDLSDGEFTEDEKMRGYFTKEGYMGLVDGEYMLFSSESEYWDFVEME